MKQLLPRVFLLLSGLALGASPARSELKWNPSDQHVTTAGAEQAAVVFSFVNAGDRPVTLLDVQPDCDCAAVEWPRRPFLPGEDGLVTARFDLGESGGVRRKRLYVTTSDRPERPVVLTVEIASPKIAEIEPRVLLWDETNPTAPKAFAVHLDDEAAVRRMALQTDSPDLTATLSRAGPNLFRIAIAPSSPRRPAAITVTLTIETAATTVRRTATVVLR